MANLQTQEEQHDEANSPIKELPVKRKKSVPVLAQSPQSQGHSSSASDRNKLSDSGTGTGSSSEGDHQDNDHPELIKAHHAPVPHSMTTRARSDIHKANPSYGLFTVKNN